MTMVQQLLLLSVFFYAAGALLAVVMRRVGNAAAYGSAISTFAGGCAGLGAAVTVLVRGQSFAAEFPGFVPFAQFPVEVDALSACMLLVISLLVIATALYSFSYDVRYADRDVGVFGFLNNLFILSMVLVVASANAFNFLVFWELMTLTSYFLVVGKQDRAAIRAGLVYFAVAHAAAAALIVAFVVLFLHAGSFDYTAFRRAALSPATQSLVFLLCFFGFGTKAGVVPLHFWLPQTYSAAPATVAALMSAKVALYGLIRVGVDVLGASQWWWGLIVLAFGAVSAVLGILYATNEPHLKRKLAYSSTENVGIILMGVGVGMLGIATGHPVLGVLGLLAGVYHLVNHAVFKVLLFLSTGAVIAQLRTDLLDEMGGLAKRMPWTGMAFLTGALAISALPPLNGFVSEWFLYQSLFLAGTNGNLTVKALSPLFAVLLAITGALAAMCFVKAYGVAFAGPSRSDRAREATEVPRPMRLGMAVLVAGCLVLGLGAPVVVPYVGHVASALLGVPPVPVRSGLQVFPADGAHATLSTPLLFLFLVGMLTVPLLLVWVHGGMKAGRRVVAEPWACGYAYSSRMAYTATAFAQPLRVLFRPLYKLRTALANLAVRMAAYSHQAAGFIDRADSMWEHGIYGPLARGTLALGKQVQRIQQGNVRLYCLYLLITLVVLLVTTVG